MAIYMLAQEGKIYRDDRIRKYVPEVPDFSTPITLREMLGQPAIMALRYHPPPESMRFPPPLRWFPSSSTLAPRTSR